MSRYLSWIANTVLFVTCCFLVANTANTVFAALMTPEPVGLAPPPPATADVQRNFEIILDRNLFNASLLAPAAGPAVEEPEDLEATKLPLQLIGTVAAVDPVLSWAAVQDLKERKTLIVRNGDPLADSAEVVRIERRRVVLLEQGKHRELALDDEKNNGDTAQQASRTARSPARRARPRRDLAARARRATERFQVPDTQVEEVLSNPASIFQQAQFQPRYEDGEMIGMQINAIKPGSLFEEVGIQDGDIITEVNGIVVDGPEASAEVVAEFSESQEWVLVVDGADGPRTLTLSQGAGE